MTSSVSLDEGYTTSSKLKVGKIRVIDDDDTNAITIKGDDYKISQVVGAKEVEKWGGKVVLIKCVKGKSTSKIIERIKNGT